jgi:amino acid transporter
VDADANPKPALVRALGRWTLTALVINGVIGSGIFGLPDDIARDLGPLALWAYALAALGVGALMGVYAELGSRYPEAGGSYLWARDAFGRFAGIEMGWFVWLTRLASAAAAANLFTVYLGEFWPASTQPAVRAAVLVALVGGLAFVNYRGVRAGAQVSNIFTVAKLLPLLALVVGGLLLAPAIAPAPAPLAPPGGAHWLNAFVVLMFAYGGFETALIPLAEAKDPRRDVPFALLIGLVVIAGLYTALHYVAMITMPNLAGSERPLADAARALGGEGGAKFVAAGAMVSTFGFLCAQLVAVPRLTYAFAERGDFPAVFGRVHPEFRTPHASILLWGVLVLGFALYGSFIWNAVLSVASRIISYTMVCAAFVVLRRRPAPAGSYRLPAGHFFAALAFAFCVLLFTRLNRDHGLIIAVVGLAAAANWLAVRGRPD